MLVCILLTPPLLCSTPGIENMFPYSPKVSPLRLSIIWKMAENYLLGQQEMRSRSMFESRLRKSHHMLLQVPEQA